MSLARALELAERGRGTALVRARGEIVNRKPHARLVHLVHLKAAADAPEHGHVEFPAKVFLELAETRKQGQIIPAGLVHEQRFVPEPETEGFEQSHDAIGAESIQVSLPHGIADIERHADGDGLTVPQPVARHRFDLVRRPVTEVERARAAELERVAVAADMRQMQFGRAAHDVRKGRTIAGLDPRSDCLDLRKELGVPHTLKEFGVELTNLDVMSKMAPEDPTAGGNPVPVTESAARALFEKAYAGTL